MIENIVQTQNGYRATVDGVEMFITNAQYTATGSITALVDGVQMFIPADAGNRHYRELLEQGVEIAPPPDPTPEEVVAMRIAQLKQLLAETDYVALADYDKDKPEVLAQRAAWRAEIRELEL